MGRFNYTPIEAQTRLILKDLPYERQVTPSGLFTHNLDPTRDKDRSAVGLAQSRFARKNILGVTFNKKNNKKT